ncbi:MAG: glycerophosphodiester phosphodiesterase [Chloroflexi bacterium]|nr:glycerophosphodiester phosphodiesterase [Chloroflexota bacterium]
MKPLIIGHRGASASAPENTLASFRLALDMGADGVELDVTLTKDDVPVIIHDGTVDRTTNGKGLINQMTLGEVRQLDAGGWFNAKFCGEKIPTLEEVLTEISPRGIVNIELKTEALRPWPSNSANLTRWQRAKLSVAVFFGLFENSRLEGMVAKVIEETHSEKRVMVSCFNPFYLNRMRSIAPHLTRGYLYANFLPIFIARGWFMPLAHPNALHPNGTMVTPAYATWAHGKGYPLNVWTVDDPNEMKRLAALGVNSIMTNKPDVARQVLG